MNLTQKKFPDPSEIDFDSWCNKLGCTEKQLQYCIAQIGTSWISVEAFWEMNRNRIQKSVPN
ncbi:MAG: hypothetical protein HRT57_15685 [Crocinitomicaceae bacterium]|nr:hypothetical protein [Crocinitomicaceae bacterium]